MNSHFVFDTAVAAHTAGICVVPPAEDGSKRPNLRWAEFQLRRPSQRQIEQWYVRERRSGIFVVGGAVSGNLEALDFDDLPTHRAFVEAARSAGLEGLVDRVRNGYEDASPGDGRHWLYRCAVIGPNARLAERPRPDGGRDVLIEVRGEGGGVIVAPSHGGVHPTGRPYRLLRGGFGTVAQIEPEERGELLSLARAFTEVAPPTFESYSPPPLHETGDRSGDDYGRRGDVLALLQRHGWTPIYERGGAVYLRRPGKNWGISATFGYRGGRYLYVFSSSTAFEPDRGYDPLGVLATLEHNGDIRSAAQALAAMGYGRRRDRGRCRLRVVAPPPLRIQGVSRARP